MRRVLLVEFVVLFLSTRVEPCVLVPLPRISIRLIRRSFFLVNGSHLSNILVKVFALTRKTVLSHLDLGEAVAN